MKQKQLSESAVQRKAAEGGFIMVKPRAGCDSDTLAQEMATLQGVEKVVLASGEYGFLVSAKNDDALQGIRNKLKSVLKGATITHIKSHYTYCSRPAARRIARIRPGLFTQ